MVTETKVQQFVHQLEEGGWVRRVKVIVLISAIAFINYLWFFKEGNGFKGLAHEKAMEQAQIAREVARGNGFSTKIIRPAALWQFERGVGNFPLDRTPDTYHAPLPPLINAAVFKSMDLLNAGLKAYTSGTGLLSRYTYEEKMTTKLIIYPYDRIIAFVQFIFFMLAIVVSYFTARRLFDDRLAVIAVGLLLLTQRFWDYSMSGLPQMLMLFLFSGTTYLLLRAVEAQAAETRVWPWVLGVGAGFGLLALTHALTIWIFLGALVFAALHFRPRGRVVAMMLGVFLLFYGPWLIRNYMVCGTPLGLGWYSCLYLVRGTESSIMRSSELPLTDVSPYSFYTKLQKGYVGQLSDLAGFLGQSLVPLCFFPALLHLFKRPETSSFRWAVVWMWLFAIFGMAFFGMPETTPIKANDLHVLFIPLMTFYGLALILVLWSRLEISSRFLRFAFVWLLFLISSLPFLQQLLLLLGQPTGRVQWPPYVPPYIAILNQWTQDEEIIASDMPWAVAWYADRKSLWLPLSVRDFLQYNDYKQLKGQIVGLYLTPITGNKPFISDVVKGEYKDWAPFIMRTVNTKEFPLKAVTALPIDGECIYYSDRDRWTNRED